MQGTGLEDRLEDLERRFESLFGARAEFVTRAPGRVNLIGEHTDYNDGFVFPAAIDRDVMIAGRVRQDRQISAYTLNFDQFSHFSLDDIQRLTEGRERWSNYIRAIACTLQKQGHVLPGVELAAVGNVPLGSGLSSSAAMLVSAGLAFATAGGFTLPAVDLALMAQRAEREFVGVQVGIMDQYISALGRRDHALLIDTRFLTCEAVPLPASGISLVIADTNKRRGLVNSEYNRRRTECEEAVAVLQRSLPEIRALRDVSPEEFARCEQSLPDVVRRRARHVITENARTLDGAAALRAGDVSRFGELMNASHESLKSDYEVSCPELDALVEAARGVRGVYGARMTGAGFGGCTVSLVAETALEEFKTQVPHAYREATGLNTTIYVTTAAQGAERLR